MSVVPSERGEMLCISGSII